MGGGHPGWGSDQGTLQTGPPWVTFSQESSPSLTLNSGHHHFFPLTHLPVPKPSVNSILCIWARGNVLKGNTDPVPPLLRILPWLPIFLTVTVACKDLPPLPPAWPSRLCSQPTHMSMNLGTWMGPVCHLLASEHAVPSSWNLISLSSFSLGQLLLLCQDQLRHQVPQEASSIPKSGLGAPAMSSSYLSWQIP